MGKRDKVWLLAVQVEAMFRVGKARGTRDYAFLQLLRNGMRIGEVTGIRDKTTYTRWIDRKDHSKGRESAVSIVDLPGLYYQDIRRDTRCVWIHGKEGKVEQYPLPDVAMDALIRYVHEAGKGPGQKLFDFTEDHGEDLFKDIAREAGIEDWNRPGFGPHRFRAFTATDMKNKGYSTYQIRDRCRHVKTDTTELYVGRSTPEELRRMVDKVAALDEETQET